MLNPDVIAKMKEYLDYKPELSPKNAMGNVIWLLLRSYQAQNLDQVLKHINSIVMVEKKDDPHDVIDYFHDH